MRAMKDSGVEWIGEIPSTWKRIPLKRWLAFREGGAWGEEAAGDENDVVCIRVADFDYPKLAIKSVGEFTFRHYDAGVIDKLALVDGDILVEKSGGGEKTPVGRAVMYQGSTKALFANFMDRLRIPPSLSARYFLYVWTAFYQSGHVSPYIKQTTGIQNLDLTAMLSIVSAPNPDLNEQKRIASFLDAKCAQIDAIIEKQQQVIEKLKAYKQSVITEAVTKGLDPSVPMKDSGVEWIGQISSAFTIFKLKYILKSRLQYGANESGVAFSEDLPRYIRITDITPDGDLKEDGKLSLPHETASEYLLEDGDILFARSGATVGKTFIYNKTYGTCAFAGYLIRAVVGEKALARFVYYFTLSSVYESWKNGIFIQATIQNIGAEKYSNMQIPIPSIEQQSEIVEHLDRRCTKIDSVIKSKRTVIDKLTDYKKSLIYEAVTGKMEV